MRCKKVTAHKEIALTSLCQCAEWNNEKTVNFAPSYTVHVLVHGSSHPVSFLIFSPLLLIAGGYDTYLSVRMQQSGEFL